MGKISDRSLHEAIVRDRGRKCTYGYHWVEGYHRKDGTYVRGFCRMRTLRGDAIYEKTLSTQELWDGDYSTRNGYYVHHDGKGKHHVYKLKK